jgi:hypothetical protein
MDWIRVTLRFPDEQLLQRHGGLDGLMFLLFLKYSFWFFLVASVIGVAILVPVYSTGTVRTVYRLGDSIRD